MRLRRTAHTPTLASWPERTGRARVLVEDTDPASAWAAQHLLERQGYDVAVCGGPEALGGCPLVEEGCCPLAQDADVVFTSLRLSRPGNRQVVEAVAARWPDRPLIVEATRPDADTHADLLDGCRLLVAPVTSKAVEREVGAALA